MRFYRTLPQGSSLELTAFFMPVPRGFAITIRAGSFFLLRTPSLFTSLFALLKAVDPDKPASIAQVSQQVEALVLAASVPEEVEQALFAEWDAAFGKNAAVVTALRSSAIAEDGVQSFAGQYRSILGVTRGDLIPAFKKVVASLFSPRALAYRSEHGYDLDATGMKGLCTLTGAHPAWFFSTYTLTIILVRLVGSHRLDSLPRHRITLLCSALLVCCMLGLAWGPRWAFIPFTFFYGLGLGLLYPLLAATVYDRSTATTRSINSNVMMATFDASGMLAPIIGGLVIHEGFGYRGVFAATAISVGLCGLSMLADKVRVAYWERQGRFTH